APVITALNVVGQGEPFLRVEGVLSSAPSTDYRLEFFGNPTLDADGFAEGRNYLGFITVTTDAGGNIPFSFGTFYDPDNPYITATATDPANNTSEFSLILADLSIAKLAAPAPVLVGQPLTYTLAVTN